MMCDIFFRFMKYSCFLWLGLLSVSLGAKNNTDVMMFLDFGMMESFYTTGEGGAVTQSLGSAIRSKCCPIIVSGVVLHRFIHLIGALSKARIDYIDGILDEFRQLRMYEDENVYKKNSDEKFKLEFKKIDLESQIRMQKIDKEYHADFKGDETLEAQVKAVEEKISQLKERGIEIERKTNDLKAIKERFNEIPKQDLEYYFYAKCNYRFDDWLIYKSVQSDLYVMVPRFLVSESEAGTVKENSVGLMIDHPDRLIPLLTQEALNNVLNTKWDDWRVKLVAKFSVLSDFYELRSTMSDLFSAAKMRYVNDIKHMFVQNRENTGGWNIFIEGHGMHYVKLFGTSYVAGLELGQFKELLTFFSNNINVGSLYYLTCYGGGHNLELIKRHIQDIEKNDQAQRADMSGTLASNRYIVMSGALTDVVTYPPMLSVENLSQFRDHVLIDYKQYFEKMSALIKKITEKKQPINRTILLELNAAIEHLMIWETYRTEDLHGVGGVPSIWLPDETVFVTAPVGEKLYMIEKWNVSENPEPIVINDKRAITFNTPHVSREIRIDESSDKYGVEKVPAFVSLIPGNALHKLHHVTLYKGLSLHDFLEYGFFSLSSVFTKVWWINTLECDNNKDAGISDFEPEQRLVIKNFVVREYVINYEKGLIAENKVGEMLFTAKTSTGVNVYYKRYWNPTTADYFSSPAQKEGWKKISEKEAKTFYKNILEDALSWSKQ